jgi:orotate phosphoribosyltransferase
MENEIISLLAGRHGHFQMESRYHSDLWFDLEHLFDRPEQLRPFVAELARRLGAHGTDVICGPMTGGAKLAELIASELGLVYLFTERFERPGTAGLFPIQYIVPSHFRNGLRGKAVAIVDDAISAGSAARGTYADLLACGARPVALGALFIFGDTAMQFAAEKSLPLERIAAMPLGMWVPVECPLCRAGVPLERAPIA